MSQVQPPGGELAARLRMIAGYGDFTGAQIARILNVSSRQVSRLRSGEVAVTVEQLEELALIAGVPVWFARHGLAKPATEVNEDWIRRLEAVERVIQRHIG